MKSEQHIWWCVRHDPNVWFDAYPWACDTMYFPKAEWLMVNHPRVAIRLFWAALQLRELYRLHAEGMKLYYRVVG